MRAIREVLEVPEVPTQALSMTPWQADSTLCLEAMQVSYEDKTVLNVADLHVQGHQKIGIIGMSGSGKSTLINLLSGFVTPDSGRGIVNGEVMQHFAHKKWQEQMIYIPQNPYIFQTTLRENITFYTPDASEAAVLRAVEVAGLNELVAELPEGLETLLGGGARTLSGGQAQRIALARAFLDESRHILLFDEPTAHLDIETEVELKERMLPLMADRLVFFATHRLHWMHQMDQIIVLKEGTIVEMGTFESLTAQKGHFYELTKQMRREADV